MNIDNIPQELKEKNIWCVNVDKVPYRPVLMYNKLKKAKANKPDTWGKLEEALQLVGNTYIENERNKDTGKWDIQTNRTISGLSMMITEPYTFIDLDHVINDKGDLLPSAEEIIKQCNSYTEVSVSGTGIHIILSGVYDLKLNETGKHKGISLAIENWEQTEDIKPNIEIYQSKRSVVFTTNVYNGMNALNDDIEPLKWFEGKYLTKANKPLKNDNIEPIEFIAYTEFNAEVEAEAVRILYKLKNNKKFMDIFNGDISSYESGSEADMVMCGTVARYTDDTRVIDCIYRRSQMYLSGDRHKKWDRPDYKERTIKKALENKTKLKRNEKGVPLHTKENTEAILNILGYDVGYDVLLNDVCITNINQKHDIGYYINKIYSYCRSIGFNIKKNDLEEYIYWLARERPYNRFREYLLTCESSKSPTEEFKKLLNTIEYDIPISEIQEYEEIKTLYDSMVLKFLISIVVINIGDDLFRKESPNIEGTLVLKGPQGIGKTTWFRNLVPKGFFKEGAILNDHKDTKIETYKYILVELGELETTTRKEATGFLKNELTRTSIEYRVPYAKSSIKFARHTMFCGTVNEDTFLKDSTGNRRFWVIPVKSIDLDTQININDLWAEIVTTFRLGCIWYLDKDEKQLLEQLNKNYVDVNYIGMVLESTFDFTETDKNKWLYARTEAVIDLIRDSLSKNTTKNMIITQLKMLGCEYSGVRLMRGDRKKTKLWKIPPIKNVINLRCSSDIYKKSNGEFIKLFSHNNIK
ncbi:VapE domain-containing protein [Peptostreptococcus porci]|uniref:phage NrS-1 polymerase family protein n=1 Tax=Peptostreptococcus porci TaxID=2652282 RepID=UPI002A91C990|nr:VapE domain-containing protein [Peptostreptococcus porci]MDY6231921.1 VapE family protein [Peptostreptococcus porci]